MFTLIKLFLICAIVFFVASLLKMAVNSAKGAKLPAFFKMKKKPSGDAAVPGFVEKVVRRSAGNTPVTGKA